MNAFGKVQMQDFREYRARAFCAAIMQEIMHEMPDDCYDGVSRALFDVLYRNGACWTTEEERQRFGLDPRDELGWTLSEKEQRRAEIIKLMASVPSIFAPK